MKKESPITFNVAGQLSPEAEAWLQSMPKELVPVINPTLATKDQPPKTQEEYLALPEEKRIAILKEAVTLLKDKHREEPHWIERLLFYLAEIKTTKLLITLGILILVVFGPYWLIKILPKPY